MGKVLTALAAASFIAAPALSATVAVSDRAALERLKDANDDAWNRRDAATITSQYVPSATVRVAPGADLVAGRDAIGRFFAAAFARRQGEFRHVTSLAHIEPLDESTVLSEGDVRVEKLESNGDWALVRRFRTISIAVRDNGSWKLRLVRAIPVS
jgi:ketosteroid isomerase-like protein